MTLSQTPLLYELQPPSAVLTLNRPERRNALSLSLMQELTARLREAAADARARVVILRSSGGVFSAGHDLRELVGCGEDSSRPIFDACVELMETIQQIPQPVIAEVDGLATAAGCQLVATCDLALASPRAGFATPGVSIGLFCSTPMVALSRVVGRKRALEMLLTGAVVDAVTAADWGLVNRVVPTERLPEATRELAEQIASASSYTLEIGKQAFYRQIDLPQPEAYRYASEVMVRNSLAHDAQEGISAFLEKRPPIWRGR